MPLITSMWNVRLWLKADVPTCVDLCLLSGEKRTCRTHDVLTRSPHLPWGLAGGAFEGGTEGALVGVAQQEGDLGQVELRLPEIFHRKFMP